MTKSSKKTLTSLAALSMIATVPVETIAPMTDDELQAALIETPATEEVPQATNLPAEDAAPAKDAAPVELDDLIAALEDDVVEAKAEKILDAFDDRIAFEAHKNPDNLSIAKNIRKYRSKLGLLSAAAVMCACSVDEGFINRSLNAGSSYNVYAIDKLADLVQALNGGTLANSINIAVMKSMFKFRAAGEVFNGDMARAAASDKIRLQGNIQRHLVRYTVSANTAPTQASSTMSALKILGVVINKGTPKHPVYELTDTPATRKLEQVLMAA